MARLLDDVLTMLNSPSEPVHFSAGRDIPRDSVRSLADLFGVEMDGIQSFVIDDVMNSFFTEFEGKRRVNFFDLPRYAPPFKEWWMEGRLPNAFRLKFNMKTIGLGGPLASQTYDDLPIEWKRRYGSSAPRGTHWVTLMALFKHTKEKPFCDFFGRLLLYSDKQGTLLNYETTYSGDLAQQAAERNVPLDIMFYPFVFAISLMNCRNVQQELVEPPPALSRKREKEKGSPLHSYHVLRIRPMVKVKTTRHIQADEPEPQPLSMVRGHFKDYRKGSGLYGKWRDIFWWDAFTRGDPQAGVSVHDYEVLND